MFRSWKTWALLLPLVVGAAYTLAKLSERYLDADLTVLAYVATATGAILTAVYTRYLAQSTRDLQQTADKTLEHAVAASEQSAALFRQQLRPFVGVAEFSEERRGIMVTVENSGGGYARDVRVSVRFEAGPARSARATALKDSWQAVGSFSAIAPKGQIPWLALTTDEMSPAIRDAERLTCHYIAKYLTFDDHVETDSGSVTLGIEASGPG